MKLKRVLASILCFAMVLSTMCFSVSAESEYVLGGADFETNDGVVFDGKNYYKSLANAVKAVHAIDDAILYCKPGADLGAMTHGHVCKNLTVFGNSAYLSGGEQDFEIDFPEGNGNPCSGLTGDVTLTVDNLTGAGAWGSRTSEYDVNLVFTNCKSMGKVFYGGTSGEVNITMTDCTFTSNDISNCKVYSNAAGVITLTNVDFFGIEQPVALGNKSEGTQTIVLADCDFVDCGAATQDYTVPVSVKSKNVDGSSVLTVKDCTFKGTKTNSIDQDADILLDYGVGKTTATIVNTTAKVGVEIGENVTEYAVVNADDSVIMTNESAATLNPVAEINGTYYATLASAIEAAADGDTVKLISDIELNSTVQIPENKSITLDLAGKAITVTKNGDTSLFAFENKGTLTLTDTVGNGSITARIGVDNYGTLVMNGGIVVACDQGGAAIYNNENCNAVFTMNDGTLKTTYVGSYADSTGGACLRNMAGAKALITGGTLDSVSERTYAIISNGELEITPASGKTVTVTAPRGIAIDNGTAVINGGTFTTYDNPDVYAYETYYPLYIGGGESVIVNGGTFNAPDQALWHPVWDAENVTEVVINGGTFNASLMRKDDYYQTSEITINGGTFSEAPIKDFWGEGYSVVENADGTFTVVEKKDEVRTIGSKSAVLRYLDEGTNKYRFLIFTGIDNLAYKEVGYIINTTDGKSIKKSTNSVYTKISVNGTEYKAADFSAEDGSYISNYIFYQGIGFSDLEYIKTYGISYTPYAITNDGTEIYGAERTFEKIEK